MEAKAYLELPYHIVIQHKNDESGSYYFATVMELDGCMSDGDTYAEACENIQEAMALWVECALDYGDPVPLPIEDSYRDHLVFDAKVAPPVHLVPDLEARPAA